VRVSLPPDFPTPETHSHHKYYPGRSQSSYRRRCDDAWMQPSKGHQAPLRKLFFNGCFPFCLVVVSVAAIAVVGGFFRQNPLEHATTVRVKPRPAPGVVGQSSSTSSQHQNEPQQGKVGIVHENDDDQSLELPPWLHSYVEFHNDELKSLRDTSTTSLLSKRRYKSLIWSCRRGPSSSSQNLANHGNPITDSPRAHGERGLCGGTGDRLGGIIQAFYMAMCTNRLFFVDWQDPSPLEQFLEPNRLMWNSVSADVLGIDKDRWTLDAMDDYQNPFLIDPGAMPNGSATIIEIRTNIWTGQIHRSTCMRNYVAKFGLHDASDVGASNDDDTFEEYYFRLGFAALFRWSGAVLEHTRRVRERLHLPSSSVPTVAIHLRTGLGETFRDLVLPTAEEDVWPLYYRCAKRLQRALEVKCGLSSDDRVSLYLATDATPVLQHFGAYGDPTVTFVNGTPVYHLDRTDRVRLGASAEESELQVWTDLQLLVESTCIVYTDKSKFSRLGQWLHARRPPQRRRQSPRCAFTFNKCRDQDVEPVMAALDPDEACRHPVR
jgi:hypothetical protein